MQLVIDQDSAHTFDYSYSSRDCPGRNDPFHMKGLFGSWLGEGVRQDMLDTTESNNINLLRSDFAETKA